jgi:hypothetical protein
VNALIHHTTDELRAGLRRLAEGEATSARLLPIKDELCLAGFLCDGTKLTPAGRRFLRSSS